MALRASSRDGDKEGKFSVVQNVVIAGCEGCGVVESSFIVEWAVKINKGVCDCLWVNDFNTSKGVDIMWVFSFYSLNFKSNG